MKNRGNNPIRFLSLIDKEGMEPVRLAIFGEYVNAPPQPNDIIECGPVFRKAAVFDEKPVTRNLC